MGGGGFAMDAVNSIRANRALTKKRKFKDIRNLIHEVSGKTELEFKKISTQKMAKIKARIRMQHQKNIRNEIIIYGISTILTFCLLFGLYLSIT